MLGVDVSRVSRLVLQEPELVGEIQVNFWPIEEEINLLEGQSSRFGVEEVDHPDEAEVEDGEVDVSVAADVLDGDRGDLDWYVSDLILNSRTELLTDNEIEQPNLSVFPRLCRARRTLTSLTRKQEQKPKHGSAKANTRAQSTKG